MKVIVVGAGIAGLSAAIGLRRAGHEILILDKSSLSHEVGAAIHVQANASRVVANWGFDFQRARLVKAKSVSFISGDKLTPLQEIDLSNIENEYGSGYFYSHRVDLHNELRLLATGEEGVGKPAVIHNKCQAVGYDTIHGSVTLANGTIVTADLIIGADGIHSSAVKQVTGFGNPAVPTGTSCFRCLMPVEEIRNDPECAFLMDEMEGKAKSFNLSTKRVVWYPCRENKVLNVVFICPDKEELNSTEGWNVPVPKETFLDELDDFHPALRALLTKAKDVRLWKLLFRAPLPTWHRGRLILIGDASHPMLPYQGQAGAQAIEDGCALGILFSQLPNTSTPRSITASPSTSTPVDIEIITSRLQAFERVRKNRASAMQMFSNAGVDEGEKVKISARPFVEEGRSVPSTPAEYQEYIFRHDVEKTSREELERLIERLP